MITNYNREVRKYICSLEEQLEQILQKKGIEDYDEMDLYISVYLGIASAASQSKNVNVIYNTLLMTGYSDLYTDALFNKYSSESLPLHLLYLSSI